MTLRLLLIVLLVQGCAELPSREARLELLRERRTYFANENKQQEITRKKQIEENRGKIRKLNSYRVGSATFKTLSSDFSLGDPDLLSPPPVGSVGVIRSNLRTSGTSPNRSSDDTSGRVTIGYSRGSTSATYHSTDILFVLVFENGVLVDKVPDEIPLR